MVGDHERIGAVDAGEHRRLLHDRQHLARHLDDDVVGIAVGEQAGERAAARHAVAAGIVDDDEVDAARLLAFGGEAGAGAAADDRLAARDHGAEPGENVLACNARHRSSQAASDSGAISRNWATSASANGGSLMLYGRRIRRRRSSGAEIVGERLEQRRVGLGIVERLARRIEQRHAALGDQEAHRPFAPVELLGDPRAHRRVLLRRRAHQRDLRIVDVELAARGSAPAPCPSARNSPCRARRTSRHRECGCG